MPAAVKTLDAILSRNSATVCWRLLFIYCSRHWRSSGLSGTYIRSYIYMVYICMHRCVQHMTEIFIISALVATAATTGTISSRENNLRLRAGWQAGRQSDIYRCTHIHIHSEAYSISQIPYPQSNVTLRKTSRRQSVRTTRKNYKASALVFVNFRLNKHISKTQKKSQQKL